jgi:nucleoid-associated protein
MYLDVGKMLLAAKIQLDAVIQGGQKNYLSLYKGRGDKELADFFTHFIGLGEPLDTGSATEAFLHMVNDYTQSMDTERATEAKAQVVDYCVQQDKLGETVEFQALSKNLADTSNDESEEQFAKFIAQYQESRELPEDEELIPDRNRIRQFMRISGRSDELSMSFNADCLGESIIYDSGTDSLTITSIPNSLKMRLMKHMKN